MAKYSSSINYKITTSLDASGITKLQAELNKLENEFNNLQKRGLMNDKAVNDALSDIKRIENALDKAFSPRLGMMNTRTLMSELTAGGRSLSQIYNSLGTRGTAAFTQLYGQLGKIDTGLKSVSKTTDKVFNTLGNTVRWGLIASGFQYVLNGAHSAVQYMADLDKSLTNIRLVTDESKESMREFAKYANDAAKSLGNTTVAYTDAALIYAQQGYGLNDQKILANYTLMTANATGQDTAEVSEQMTSLINGFQLSVENVGSALDVMAKVANTSAADLEELATATAKVASTANTLGVTQEQLTAQIATIVSVTREAPENVGNALKTIYARFGDLSLGETLEDGTDLGKVSSTLQKIGVQVLDSSGKMRDMGLIMEDLMAVWDTLDTATKQGAAVTLAGKYQYNRLMALMENSDMYERYYDDALNSAGTLEEMQAEYMESLAGKAKALQASFEGLLTSLFDQDDFGVVLDGLTDIITLFDELVEAIGGGGAALTAFGAIGMNVFSNQIGRGISNIMSNREKSNIAKSNIDASVANAKAQLAGDGITVGNKHLQSLIDDTSKTAQFAGIMSDEQITKSNELVEKRVAAVQRLNAAETAREQTINNLKVAYAVLGVEEDAATQGAENFLRALEADGVGLEEAKEGVQEYLSKLTNLQLALVRMENAMGADTKDETLYWENLQTAAKNLQKEIDGLDIKLEDLTSSFKTMGKTEKEAAALAQALEQVIAGEVDSFKKLSEILKTSELTVDGFRESLAQLGTSLDLTTEKIEKQTAEEIEARNATKALANEQKGLAGQLQNQAVASYVSNMASGFMTLAFTVQSAGALIETWANEELTLTEKLSSSWMNLLMTVSMGAMAYIEMATAVNTLKDAKKAQTVIQAIEIALNEILIRQTYQLAAGESAEAVAAAAAASATGKFTTVLQRLVTVAVTAVKTFTKAHPVLLAITAAFALAAGAIKLYTEYTQQADKALESANNRLLDTQKAISNTNEQLAQVEDALELIKSNEDAFDGLTRGTKEWTEQLREANNAILEIVEKYPELAKYVTTDPETGALTLDEAGLEEYQGILSGQLTSEWAVAANAQAGVFDAEVAKVIFDNDSSQILDSHTVSQLLGNMSPEDHASLAAYQKTTFTGFDSFEEAHNNFESLIAILEKYGLSREEAAEILNNDELRASLLNLTGNFEIASGAIGGYAQSILSENTDFQRGHAVQQNYVSQELADWLSVSDYTQLSPEKKAELLAMEGSGIRLKTDMTDEEVMSQYADRFSDQGYVARGKKLYQENEEGSLEEVDISVHDAYNDLVASQIAEYYKTNAADLFPSIEEAVTSVLGSPEEGTAAANLQNAIINSNDYTNEQKLDLIGTLDQEMTEEEINATIAAINQGESVDKVALIAGGEEGFESYVETQNKLGESAAEAADIDVEEFKVYRDLLADTYPELKDNAKALNEVAVANKRLQKGVETISDDWEDFDKIMSDSSSSIEDTSKVISQMEDPMKDILNLSDEEFDFLSPDFIQENWGLIQDVMNGVEGSVDELRNKAGENILFNVGANVDLDADGQLDAEIAELHNKIASFDQAQFEVGVAIDDADFIAACNEMVKAAGMTAKQAQAYFASMGYNATFKNEPQTVSETVWDYSYDYTKDEDGNILTRVANAIPRVLTGTVDVPVIETITPNGSYGGGIGVQNTAPKSSRGGGGGGGGGGSKKPKTEKKSEEKADRYQNVNAHLDRLSGNLEKVANEQDRLVGKDMLENMNEQLDILKQQVEWHQRKLEIQQQEAAELRSELGQDYGITFDSEGYMENYEATFNKYKSEYDALVDQYNATTNEEAQEKIKEQMDEVKEKWDEFNESIERYDELVNNEILESINTLEDLENQMEDLRIEAFNMAVEAADNIKEVKDAWADYMGFMSGLDPDSPFRSLIEDAEKYENAIESVAAKQQDLDQLMQWAPQYQAGGVITSDNPFGENSAAFYEALQTAYESYIEAALAAEELYYQQIDDIMEGYDEVVDKINKRMEKYSRLTEQLDHYASVIETLYGDEDYDKLLAIKRANQDVLESSIEQSKRSLETLQAEYEKQKAAGILGEEQLEELRQHVVEAEQELEGLVEEAAQNTAEILEMAVDKTVKEWKDSMLGGDADWMETQWELIKQNSEQYLDNVEEAYEIEKLRSKYNSLANDTMDLNIRKRINEQMEQELAYLKEKDKLSEYDVNYANAKLEILQKQIALEEAQANKNQMKLRRDSQGNYSYVYSANQDDVTNAQNELMDAEFNAYNMSKENYLTNYDNYISAISAAAEQIKAINADVSLNEEEKAKRTQWIYDNLKEYLSGVAEQIGVSEQGMLESVKYLAMDSSEIVAQNYADIALAMEENWVAALETIGVAVSEEFDYVIHHMDEFLAKTAEKWGEFEDHTREWAENVQDIADDGTDGFRDIDNILIDINKDMKELNEETENFFSLINDDLGTIDSAIGKLADYEKQILGLKESSSQIAAQLQDARNLIIKKDNEIRDLQGQLEDERNKNSNPNPGGNSGGGNNDASDKTRAASVATEALKIVEGVHNGTIANGSGGWRPAARKAGYSEDAISIALAAFNDSKAGGGYSYYYDKALELVKSYDTGGYTGAWGKEGRLAMLHQKELVLNASDTENILAAVSTIRDVIAAMKGDSLNSILSLGRGSNIANNTGTNVQQNIEIYADFPAAESAAEIKTALEGLAQQAVQYSMRTR